MKMNALFPLLLCISAARAAPSLLGRAVPTGFSIANVTYAGSGCPADSAYANHDNERASAIIVFSQLYSEAGLTVPAEGNKRSCTISLDLNVPAGHSFGITNVSQRSFITLETGATAQRTSVYEFRGQGKQTTAQSSYAGPIVDQSFVTTIKSQCGQNVVLDLTTGFDVSAGANGETGYAAHDAFFVGLQWETC